MFRLTLGFFVLGAAIAMVACSSVNNANLNVGPNFPTMTLYATNSNQNAISIYTLGQKSGTGPAYQIGGSNTTLNGPRYIAFDSGQNLWVTNYNPTTKAGALVEIAALATGNVIPVTSAAIVGQPRGIAITGATPSPVPSSSASPQPSLMVIADVNPTAKYPSQLLLFTEGSTSPYQSLAGPKPGLSVPSGVTLDQKNRIYVTNLQGRGSQPNGSVMQFTLPTPSPTPSSSPTPSPTPSPTGSPTGSPSPSPSPSPTATPINVTPNFTIAGANTGIIAPTGVAVDKRGYIYVSDQGAPGATCGTSGHPSSNGPSILIFKPQTKSASPVNQRWSRKIAGCKTGLFAPNDIKVDNNGLIYVGDYSKSAGGGVVYVFAAGVKSKKIDDVAPETTYKSPGAVTGLGLVP